MTDSEKKEIRVQNCDNKSVGMFIWKDDELLLIERMKFPFGYAIPTGHIDDHGSFENAAIDETREEVGLKVIDLKLIYEGRRENKCRRPGGTWHYWKLYEVETEGILKRSLDETKNAGWYTKNEICKLAERTEMYKKGEISEEEWQTFSGLEVYFCDWAKELNII
jgi:ADP-ribose pyrophosphatase YjhB (NUDIX family)